MCKIGFKGVCTTLIAICCIATTTLAIANQKSAISDYHEVFIPGYDAKRTLKIAIRSYYKEGELFFLVVDPYRLTTTALLGSKFSPHTTKLAQRRSLTRSELIKTPYYKALQEYALPPYQIINYGMKEANRPVEGMFITVDMCPSRKDFENKFFEQLVSLSVRNKRPTPVAISITGLWIIGHKKEFEYLIEQQKQQRLAITWINHSFSHVYYHGLNEKQNFLLSARTKVKAEILDTEKLLLSFGQLPSVFFRFPGLVANKNLILRLNQLGLIPVGSNAWLAKNQLPKNGSIILVHGNGNEPEGIAKIKPMLLQSNFALLPLTSAYDP